LAVVKISSLIGEQFQVVSVICFFGCVLVPTVLLGSIAFGWKNVPALYDRPSFCRSRSDTRDDDESPRMKLTTSNAG
jgi:hypothetical protein